MTKRLEREVLALIELRRAFEFEPLTTEGLASRLRLKPDDIKHVVWGLWMDEKIRAIQDSKGAKRRWVTASTPAILRCG